MKPNPKKIHMAVTTAGTLILVLPPDLQLPVTGFAYWPNLRPDQLKCIVPIAT
jgi:hypothetical protein